MGWDGDDLQADGRSVLNATGSGRRESQSGTSSVRNAPAAENLNHCALGSRIMTQLASATNPAHRTMLESALKSKTTNGSKAGQPLRFQPFTLLSS